MTSCQDVAWFAVLATTQRKIRNKASNLMELHRFELCQNLQIVKTISEMICLVLQHVNNETGIMTRRIWSGLSFWGNSQFYHWFLIDWNQVIRLRYILRFWKVELLAPCHNTFTLIYEQKIHLWQTLFKLPKLTLSEDVLLNFKVID